MSQPIDAILEKVDWQATGAIQTDALPVATHEGVLNFLGHDLRCYRLSTSQAVINVDDMEQFLESTFGDGEPQ